MTTPISLTPDQRIPDRPFTDPEHSQGDLALMRRMARQLVATYDDPVVCDFGPHKRPICQSDPLGRHFRIYYIHPQLLFTRKQLTVVGFFGHKRPGADIKPLLRADERFEREFHRHAGLLSLSTVRLPGGDFANLVLFTDPDAKEMWNFSPVHRDLVAEISPPYYRYIRLNNGVLPDGLAAPNALRLIRVKYLDYGDNPPWRADRTFTVTPESS
jgi:hypothetical protein